MNKIFNFLSVNLKTIVVIATIILASWSIPICLALIITHELLTQYIADRRNSYSAQVEAKIENLSNEVKQLIAAESFRKLR